MQILFIGLAVIIFFAVITIVRSIKAIIKYHSNDAKKWKNQHQCMYARYRKELDNTKALRNQEVSLRMQLEELSERIHKPFEQYNIPINKMEILEVRAETIINQDRLHSMYLSEEELMKEQIKGQLAVQIGLDLKKHNLIQFSEHQDMDFNYNSIISKHYSSPLNKRIKASIKIVAVKVN